jgi:signal transduction histidine kinase
MTQTPVRKTGRELDMALSNARQTLTLLRTQAKSAVAMDPSFLDQRLGSIEQLLENLTEERKVSGQQERLAKLYEVSRVIGSSLDLQTVLNQVMDAIIQLSSAERGFLMLLDDDGNLTVRVARNFDQETIDRDAFALSRTVTRRVVETGQPIVTTNAQEDPRFAGQQSVMLHALRSIMATPLRVRGEVIGVVYVDSRVRAGLFSEQDLEILDAFGGQASVAIENARLFSATDQALAARVDELTMLQRIDRQLNETLDMERVMSITLEWSSRICNARSASMGLTDTENNLLRIFAQHGEPDMFTERGEIELTHPMIHPVLGTQEPTLQPMIAADGSTAGEVLFVPIRLTGRVIGLMALTANEIGTFKEDARALLVRMADRSAIAIENARLFQAVKAANNAKSEFVSLVAHELKVPMTSISGYADLLTMAGTVNERQGQFIATIKNSVNKMKLLVSDLNDISAIETGHLRVHIGEVSLVEAIQSATEGTITEIERRNHHLIVDIDPDLPLVLADKERLIQVLLNLMSNAYKYTPDGGSITVKANRHNPAVIVGVTDTGVGMTAEQIAKLGTKFWRADNGLQQPGTGLGFAITRKLIELMNGELNITSEIGKGSTIAFTLPVAR